MSKRADLQSAPRPLDVPAVESYLTSHSGLPGPAVDEVPDLIPFDARARKAVELSC